MTDKQMQLFIIPYAGGSAVSFRKLTALIDERVETVTVEFPGRGTRSAEPLERSFKGLVDDVRRRINDRRTDGIPYAVMGYSMGSVITYEILSGNGIKGELKHFFISAEVSPETRALELRQLKNPTDADIIARVRLLGGFDERLAKDRRFAQIYLKPMLSDYRLFSEYRFTGCGHRIEADVTAFYCENDTPLRDVKEWQKLIDGEMDFYEFGKTHFFINSHYKEMAEIINCNLRKYLQGENK